MVETTALIVTDGSESTQVMAEAIAAEIKKCKVTFVSAANFKGTDLLPADFCFFGAENPNPPSFSYLYEMLQHINLVNRPCGIFSNSKETINYLNEMVKDSELDLQSEPFTGECNIKDWITRILSKI